MELRLKKAKQSSAVATSLCMFARTIVSATVNGNMSANTVEADLKGKQLQPER